MVHWRHLPLAIAEEEEIHDFRAAPWWTGGTRADYAKHATKQTACLIAIYTAQGRITTQYLAYSTSRAHVDDYSGNPIVDLKQPDFGIQDFWYVPERMGNGGGAGRRKKTDDFDSPT